MNVGSLFSGAGLGDLGLEWAGFQHSWFCEIEPSAQEILKLRWPGVPVYDDVRGLSSETVEPVDVLVGGFPCQDVSNAGLRRGIIAGETRSGLWFEYLRLIEELKPKYAIIENVAALVSRGLDIVLKTLAEIGYDAEWKIFRAFDFSLPHTRERVFVVAYPNALRLQGVGNARIFSQEREIAQQQLTRLPSMADWYDLSTSWVGFKDDGGAKRTAGLQCLGNGICPQKTEYVGRLILSAEAELNE